MCRSGNRIASALLNKGWCAMVQGIFRYRKSRRLAEVEIDGEIVEAYVSNGAQLRFMKDGCICYLREAFGEKRKTAYDFYSIYDGDTLVCVDVKEPLQIIKPWYTEKLLRELNVESLPLIHENTRDSSLICFREPIKDMVVQVMGTSLVEEKTAYLPDISSSALNERLADLIWMKDNGQDPRLVFVVCRDDAECFTPNAEVDPYFADMVKDLYELGVPVDCVRCTVNADGMAVDTVIPLRFGM